jgi:hypothetical protein
MRVLAESARGKIATRQPCYKALNLHRIPQLSRRSGEYGGLTGLPKSCSYASSRPFTQENLANNALQHIFFWEQEARASGTGPFDLGFW